MRTQGSLQTPPIATPEPEQQTPIPAQLPAANTPQASALPGSTLQALERDTATQRLRTLRPAHRAQAAAPAPQADNETLAAPAGPRTLPRIVPRLALVVSLGSLAGSFAFAQSLPLAATSLAISGVFLLAMSLAAITAPNTPSGDNAPLSPRVRAALDPRNGISISNAIDSLDITLSALRANTYAPLPALEIHAVAHRLATAPSTWREDVADDFAAQIIQLQKQCFAYQDTLSEPPPGVPHMPEADYIASLNTAMFLHHHGIHYSEALAVLRDEFNRRRSLLDIITRT